MDHVKNEVEVKPLNQSKVKTFIRVTVYLAAITAFEYLIAFTVPHEYKWTRIIVFVALTIVKAYFIVSEFMHLGHERKSLIASIIYPMAFVCFFIFIMIYQGGALLTLLSGR